jgi:competence protein ComEC
MAARRPPPMLAAGVPLPSACRVTVLAVGAGQCIAVEPPGGRLMLIDAGSSTMGDPLAGTIAPFLRSRGRTSVDGVLLTHANLDHYGAAADLVTRYGVREVLAPPPFAEHAQQEAAGRALLATLDRADRPPRSVTAGDAWPLSRLTNVEVLWPPAGADDLAANDSSLVLRLEHAGRVILFTADIEEAAMAALLADDAVRPKLKCDVLVAPHHGSAEANTAAFVAACDPLLVVSSNDRTLSRKQLEFENRIQNRPLWRTHETGAVTLLLRGDGTLHAETFLDRDDRRSMNAD